MGMGYKIELDNIVCVVAEQAYVSAKNKHSCVRIVNRHMGHWVSSQWIGLVPNVDGF